MFSEQAFDKSGNAVNIQDFDLIGLYFSGHWCPPCQDFTPKLVEAYNTWKQQDESIEIIFISCDSDEGSSVEYYAGMPWARVPFNKEVFTALEQQFKLPGVPHLVIFDRGCNKIISDHGYGEVHDDTDARWGSNSIHKWNPLSKKNVAEEKKRVAELKMSGAVREFKLARTNTPLDLYQGFTEATWVNVEAQIDLAKEAFLTDPWVTAKVEQGSMDGSGHGYKTRKQEDRDCGHRVIEK